MTDEAPPDRAASFADNLALWEAWTALHADSQFYDLEGFRAGGIRLRFEHAISEAGCSRNYKRGLQKRTSGPVERSHDSRSLPD